MRISGTMDYGSAKPLYIGRLATMRYGSAEPLCIGRFATMDYGSAKPLSLAAAIVMLAGAALTGACSQDELGHVYGNLAACQSASDIECEPPIIAGALRVGEQHDLNIWLRNFGTGILDIDHAEIDPATGVTVGSVPASLGADIVLPMTVRVSPTMGSFSFDVVIVSNDPEKPRYQFQVKVEGVGPVLVVCPTLGLVSTPTTCATELWVDVSSIRPTQGLDVRVLVRNAGALPLALNGAEISLTESTEGELTVMTSVGEGTVEAGGDRPVVVRYRPTDEIVDQLVATFSPKDQAVPPAVLHIGAARNANEPPTAVAVEYYTRLGSAETKVGQVVWVDGTQSSDPERDPLAFHWSVTTAPAGASPVLTTPDAKLSSFTADVLGDYVVTLDVADSLGQAGRAQVTITVRPIYQLTVSASFLGGSGDVDLHMVPTGEPLFGSSDCNFMQTSPDWGRRGDATDDPQLQSDTEGSGNERIVIKRPAAGSYDIYANYFDDHGGEATSVRVEVTGDDGTVAIGGASDTLRTTCETWKVGTLSWPAGELSLAGGAHSDTCYAAN